MARPTKSTIDSLKNWILDAKGDMEEAGYKGFKQIDHVVVGSNIHHTEHLIFRIPRRYALLNIQDLVDKIVDKSGVSDGFVFVSSMHTSAAVFLNDADTGLLHDIARKFTHLAPYSETEYDYSKPTGTTGATVSSSQDGKDSGDAHLKSILIHHSVSVPITKSRLDIGPDQYLFYAEFDGLRDKRIIVKVTGISSAPQSNTQQ